MRVIIIGGGIGGLALAQSLRRAGIGVQVYERDRFRGSRWEGYRIHINPAGSRALRACLPDQLWAAFLATAAPGGDFGLLTERLRELVVVGEDVMYPDADRPSEDHYAVASRPIEPWPSSPVVLLGDAIHAMPPIGGLGGNTALRDAHLLGPRLAAVHRGERALVDAARTWLRTCATVPAMRRRTFADWDAQSRPRPWELVA